MLTERLAHSRVEPACQRAAPIGEVAQHRRRIVERLGRCVAGLTVAVLEHATDAVDHAIRLNTIASHGVANGEFSLSGQVATRADNPIFVHPVSPARP
jgi:hypothetical protein